MVDIEEASPPPGIILEVQCGTTLQTTIGGVVVHIVCADDTKIPDPGSGGPPPPPRDPDVPPPPRGGGYAALDIEQMADRVRTATEPGSPAALQRMPTQQDDVIRTYTVPELVDEEFEAESEPPAGPDA